MIKIEVTGNSIPEVADKLLAIGNSLRVTTSYDADNAAREELQAKRTKTKKVDPVMPEVADMASAPEPAAVASEPASSVSNTATAQPEESAKSEISKSTEGSESASASTSELSFDADVAPYVLQVVKEKGKPVAEEILSQFGVAKASLLDPAQWPELVAALKDAL